MATDCFPLSFGYARTFLIDPSGHLPSPVVTRHPLSSLPSPVITRRPLLSQPAPVGTCCYSGSLPGFQIYTYRLQAPLVQYYSRFPGMSSLPITTTFESYRPGRDILHRPVPSRAFFVNLCADPGWLGTLVPVLKSQWGEFAGVL